MNHITIRLITSPSESLDVELLGREAGSLGGTAHALDPRLGATDVDVAVGQVGDPVLHGGQVVDPVEPGPEPGVTGAPVTGQRYDAQPTLAGDDLELAGKQRLVGVAVEEHGVAGCVGEPLRERPER